ncbi:MAG TPA: tetratricopeptide repeat protein, partial [Gemmatimonadales bacterium]|nr:tetratricopeptide repeat protein [Gemmatimonadales bacterium]
PRSSTPQKSPRAATVDEATALAELQDLQDGVIDDSTKRPGAITKGTSYYNMTNVSTKLRAEGAVTVGFTYMQEQQWAQARAWMQRAVALDPSKQGMLDGVNRAQQQAANPSN